MPATPREASLPTMADDLDASESLLAWAVTGMFLMTAVATPVLGRLGDVHGHRRLFLAGATVIAVGLNFLISNPDSLGKIQVEKKEKFGKICGRFSSFKKPMTC